MKRFRGNAIQHIYQRSVDGGVIFYDDYDRILFCLLLNHYKWRHNIRIIAVSIMYNHFHLLVKANAPDDVVRFVQETTSHYAKLFNEAAGIKGKLFKRTFGYASKNGEKSIKTAIAYVYNNHTEKKLCRDVLEMRWNLLAYAFSPNPYSVKFDLKSASSSFRQARKSALYLVGSGQVPKYNYLHQLYRKLDREEAEQITDLIISKLALVDYDFLFSFYKSPKEMVYAVNSVAGAEYDLKEPADLGDDRPYVVFTEMVKKAGFSTVSKEFLNLRDDRIIPLIDSFLQYGFYLKPHIDRYLHLSQPDHDCPPESFGSPESPESHE